MRIVVPTITALGVHDFTTQTDLISSISDYAHLDLASSDFSGSTNLVDFRNTYLDPVLTYSVHVMYQKPLDVIKFLLNLTHPPKLIILQVESDDSNLIESIKLIKDSSCSLGIALLKKSDPKDFSQLILLADQALIFSGNLGEYGGTADLNLISKIKEIKNIKSNIEIAWDGGINKDNIEDLAKAGIDVFYVGGSIHKSSDPYQELQNLQNLVDQTTSS
ncbi:MAG: hypothetical protein H6799_02745 [Candidatus Nomurabacteria bacterium]|nr:MAG: hypothetical protein H6799_02745 [Candidatus Nomurabacteria bacterium]HRV75833.1 hypothetical protein [Candidatus Saccharimonadales bacterium]